MSPEQFHDALNYLDDDLIEQTDDLRQGRRVLQARPTARRVISWAVPAACLVLILGFGPRLLPVMEADNAASIQHDGLLDAEKGAPGESVQEQTIYGSTSQSANEAPVDWQRVSNNGIALSIPSDWEYELAIADDGSYFIVIRPAGAEGSIQVGYMPGFGVCGTGLTEKETTIAGMKARVGYYDGSAAWSFITFPEERQWYVILNEGADSWPDIHEETIARIFETIEFEE